FSFTFFFSSRRRHTRSKRDWSSDVCSSDLGHVCGIRFLRTRLGEPDAQGRRRPVPIEGSEFVMPADAVIMAFGFNPHGMPWLESHGVTVDKWGRIIADVES